MDSEHISSGHSLAHMRLIKSHVSCEWLLPGRQGGGRVRSVVVGVPSQGPRQRTGSLVRFCGRELLCFS